MRSGTQILAHLADATSEMCPLCDGNAVIEVCTTVKFTNVRDEAPYTIPNFLYFVCDNPECQLEFVNSRQARHNENNRTNTQEITNET